MTANYTAPSAAAFLLGDSGLSEWQIGFLAVALDEVAEHYDGIVTDKKCMNELLQMNSQHRGSIEGVARALTGHVFELSWCGEYGSRIFKVLKHEKRQQLAQAAFDLLHDECGWGSDAHRIALGALGFAHS